MGRRKSGIWRNFSEFTVDGVIRARCDTCRVDVVASPDRMQKHLDKCISNKDDEAGPSAMKQAKLPVSIFTTSKSQQHQMDLQAGDLFII
jgi:hypothetical protein